MNVVIEACSATDYIIECTSPSCRHRKRLSETSIDNLRQRFPNQSDGNKFDKFRSFIFTRKIISKLICSKCKEKNARITFLPNIQESIRKGKKAKNTEERERERLSYYHEEEVLSFWEEYIGDIVDVHKHYF